MLDKNTKHRGSRHTTIMIGAAVAVIGLAACGQQQTDGSAVTKGVASNVTVAIDNTTIKNSRVLAEQMKAKVQQVVDPILVGGGHVRIAMFAQAGVAPVNLIDEQVPMTADLSGVRRDNFLITARKNIGTLLGQALGLSAVPTGSALAAQLEAMPSDGSDVAGMIRTAVAGLAESGGGALVAVGDGLQRSQGVDFSTDLMKVSATQAADMIAPLMPTDASGVSISMYGVGNAGRSTTTTERSIKAVATWTTACQRTKAKACTVSPTI